MLEVDWSGLIRQLRGVALAHSHLQHAKLGERDPIPWSLHEGKSWDVHWFWLVEQRLKPYWRKIPWLLLCYTDIMCSFPFSSQCFYFLPCCSYDQFKNTGACSEQFSKATGEWVQKNLTQNQGVRKGEDCDMDLWLWKAQNNLIFMVYSPTHKFSAQGCFLAIRTLLLLLLIC